MKIFREINTTLPKPVKITRPIFSQFWWLLILGAGLALLFFCYQAQSYSFRVEVGTPGDSPYLAGFYPEEQNTEFNFRWSKRESFVNLYYPGAPYELRFHAAAPRPDNHLVEVVIIANGQEVGRPKLDGTPQVYTLRPKNIIWGPEELAITFRPLDTFAEDKGRKDLGLVLDWVEVAAVKNQFGINIPPPFTLLWWAGVGLLPFLLAKLIALPRRLTVSLSTATFLLVGILYLWPETSRLLHSDLILTGLQVVLGQLAVVAGLKLFIYRRFPPQPLRRSWWDSPALLLFCGLLLLYLATMRGYLSYGDDQIMLAVSDNIAAGNPAKLISSFPNVAPFHSKYGIGLSLVGTSFYALGQLLSERFPFMLSGRVNTAGLTTYLTLLLGPFLVALSAVVLYWAVRSLGYSKRIAFLCGVLFGITTMSWHYSRTFLSEPLVMLCLITALAATLAYRNQPLQRWAILAGFSLGLAVATRSLNLAILPVFLLYFLTLWWQSGRSYRVGLKLALAWGTPLLGWLLVVGWWNWARFGNPLATGYGVELDGGFTTPLWEGLYGLLFSPGKSIFLYNPVLLLGLAGIPGLVKAQGGKGILLLVGGISLSYLFLYSLWYDWFGGGVWGPRFLVPLLPLAFLPVAALFDLLSKVSWRSFSRKMLPALGLGVLSFFCIILSFLIQLLSVVVSYQLYASQYAKDGTLFAQMIYQWPFSPILKSLEYWQNGTRPDFAPRFYHDTPFARFTAFFQSGAWFLLLVVLGLALLFNIEQRSKDKE